MKTISAIRILLGLITISESEEKTAYTSLVIAKCERAIIELVKIEAKE